MRGFFPNLAGMHSLKPALLDGKTLELEAQNWGHVALFKEIFIEQVYDLSQVPFYPDWILDCGAHIGSFTLLAATKFSESKIKCYEPNPYNFERLSRHCQINNIDAELNKSALSIKDGEASFSFDDESLGGSLGDSTGKKMLKHLKLKLKTFVL